MRTIIAGSSRCPSVTIETVARAVRECGWDPSLVISGAAMGADRAGELWAEANEIPILRCPANWDLHGRSAGIIRNTEMAGKADALIALWDGKSRGTYHMINVAQSKGLRVYVHKLT